MMDVALDVFEEFKMFERGLANKEVRYPMQVNQQGVINTNDNCRCVDRARRLNTLFMTYIGSGKARYEVGRNHSLKYVSELKELHLHPRAPSPSFDQDLFTFCGVLPSELCTNGK